MMGTTGQSDGIHLHFEVQHGESSDYRVDMYPLFAWEDATYTPGWENYAGPHTGDKCTPGAAGTTAACGACCWAPRRESFARRTETTGNSPVRS